MARFSSSAPRDRVCRYCGTPVAHYGVVCDPCGGEPNEGLDFLVRLARDDSNAMRP